MIIYFFTALKGIIWNDFLIIDFLTLIIIDFLTLNIKAFFYGQMEYF